MDLIFFFFPICFSGHAPTVLCLGSPKLRREVEKFGTTAHNAAATLLSANETYCKNSPVPRICLFGIGMLCTST